jgi:hypothetical protein
MRKLLLGLFVFVFTVAPATAEFRSFVGGKCPYCVEQTLTSTVTVERDDECYPKVCDGEHWDASGKFKAREECHDCTPKYYFKCSQGHSFESYNNPYPR